MLIVTYIFQWRLFHEKYQRKNRTLELEQGEGARAEYSSIARTDTLIEQDEQKWAWHLYSLITNKLSLNVGKSNVLIFRGKNTTIPAINISIKGILVEEKDHAQYLGVFIDNKAFFSKHIEHVKTKLMKGNTI